MLIRKLIFLGPPGVGKGTVATLAKDILKIPHISTGDIFRDNIKRETELGQKVKAITASGALVPDDITNAIVADRLKQDDVTAGFILDGYPRTIGQADFLSTIMTIDAVINFTAPDEEIIERLAGRRTCPQCGAVYNVAFYSQNSCERCGATLVVRPDDKEEAIKFRLTEYNKKTAPLIKYYREKGLLHDLDSSSAPSRVMANLLEIID